MKKYIFNKKIYPYMEECIDEGKQLAKSFKENNNYNNGIFYTYVPENDSEESFYNFRHGWTYGEEEYKTKILDYLKNFIIKHLLSDVDAVCISQGGEEQVGDKWLENYKEPYKMLTYNKDIYWLLTNTQSDLSSVERYIQISGGFVPTQMIFLTYSSQLHKINNITQEIDLSQINESMKRTTKVIINAYDFRGYIFWENL
jgi:hypothetical protein